MALKIILLADNDFSRMKGLMFHPGIKDDECALFKFQRAGQYGFWNKNVDFPLTLIFCDKNGVVKDVKKMEAQQTKIVYPDSYDIHYVVESTIKTQAKKGSKITITEKEVFLND